VIETVRLTVAGMTCGGCENAVKRALLKLDGVVEVTPSHIEGSVVVVRDADRIGLEAIRQRIEALGYRVAAPPA